MSHADCTSVTPNCPVEATTYGYYPDLGVNSFFVAFFGLLLIIQLLVGVSRRTWTYTLALSIGSLLETLGYIGRVMMHFNPWSNSGFEMQICCLILAPTFTAASIYLTLKHLVIYCGPEYSRIRARLYPWIFVGCDFGSIVLQAIGGGISAGAGSSNNQQLLNVGSGLIIAGIAFQIATMSVAGLLIMDYFLRRRGAIRQTRASLTHAVEKLDSHREADAKTKRKLHLFCVAVLFAYTTILIRCIYRLPEMAGGWGNPRMRIETDFLLLDGMMIALATLALTVFHPGYFFPSMRETIGSRAKSQEPAH